MKMNIAKVKAARLRMQRLRDQYLKVSHQSQDKHRAPGGLDVRAFRKDLDRLDKLEKAFDATVRRLRGNGIPIRKPLQECDLELLALNAGEGAFHWIRCHTTNRCGGWIFDCGTRNGRSRLSPSIQAYAASGFLSPAVVILSHYHTDHYSGFEQLGSTLLGPVREVWVPRIDPQSMQRYLRVLAFGTLFQPARKFLRDRSLSAIFCRRRGLAPDIEAWLDNPRIVEVAEGHRSGCPKGQAGIAVEVLTPPEWPDDEHHPLAEPTGRIRAAVKDARLGTAMRSAADSMLGACVERPEFLEYLRTEEYSLERLQRFGQAVVDALSRPPEPRNAELDMAVLRVLLWLDRALPPANRNRIRRSELPRSTRDWIGRWPNVVRDATHLFNVSAIFRGAGGTQFLLTGDADTRLWPKILEWTRNQELAAVQVPHHGSEDNVVWEAYADLHSRRFIVSADQYKMWRHPSARLAAALIEGRSRESVPRLYCTSHHANCEIMRDGEHDRCPNVARTAVSFPGTGAPEWIQDTHSAPATACPFVVGSDSASPLPRRGKAQAGWSGSLCSSRRRVHLGPGRTPTLVLVRKTGTLRTHIVPRSDATMCVAGMCIGWGLVRGGLLPSIHDEDGCPP